jgi:spoIIIJ-associated protein
VTTDGTTPGDDVSPQNAAIEAGDIEAENHDAPESDDLEREGDVAADYLEALLDIMDLDGDIDMDVENSRASVSIVADDDSLGVLVGDGRVLESLQELTRLAVGRVTGTRSRLMLDVAGHRAGVRARLTELAQQVCEQVRASGEPQALDPMSPFERKAVHDAIAAEGLRSESEGEGDNRHVVVHPVGDPSDTA